MIEKESKCRKGVYKVQTFRTTQFREEIEKLKIKELGRLDLTESPGEDPSTDPSRAVAKSP